jgi:CelD/BcsL family acetyltransferase involved in cellulose biosynthesis
MEVLRSIPQLEALRDEWNALADLQGHALLRHEWTLSAARTLHGPQDLAVVVRRSGGRLDAVAPLARVTGSPVERLEFIGAEALYEPTGFLTRDARAREALLGDLVRLRRPLMLRRLPGGDETSDLRRIGSGRGMLVVKHTAPALAVPIANGGPEPLAQLPGKLRYDVKRARTRAAEHGAVSVEMTAPREHEADAALDAFMTVEASGWKGRNGSAMSMNPKIQSFFRTFCRLSAAAGTLRVAYLRAGSTLAAVQLGIDVYERRWVLKIGYDEAMARCSPGLLLTAEAIADAHRRGLRSYEFLGSAEAWEERWRPEQRPCVVAAFYPWSVRGGMSASMDIADAVWKRIRPAQRLSMEAATS